MSDDADLDGARFRMPIRPWLIAGAINVAVAGVLLGIPYVRGGDRASEVPARWAAFAACFYHAEPAERPGLGLPPGERARYASLVIQGPGDWPARCEEPLRAIPPEESMFLFPGIKNAEAQLRAAVDLMATEMETLAERRGDGDRHVPDRPARAMQRLRGALAELGLSSGVAGLDADREAVLLPEETDPIPESSIVPLRVSEGRTWGIAVAGGALLASTMDSRSVVHVSVDADGVLQRVSRRPRLVNAVLGARETPWLVWSMSSGSCAETEDRCVRRTTGLAAFLEDRQTLEPMMWLGGHPLGSPERSVHIAGRVAHVIAPAEGEGARVLRFTLIEPVVRALGEEREPPRIAAEASWPIGARPSSSVAWIEGEPLRVAYAHEGGAGLLSLGGGAEEAPTEAPLAIPEGHLPQLATCGAWLVAATDAGTSVRHLGSDATHAVEARIVPPELGRLRVVCADDRVEVWTLADHALTRTVCTAEACQPPQVVADEVAAFDVERHADHTVLAATDDLEEGVVRLTRFGGEGRRTFVPAPCWSDPADGLCGEPRLASDGTRLVLVTRQEEDLRVVESLDGLAFRHLTGLERR